LFWQFTVRTFQELDIVSNQNLSIEMFLIRLMHLSLSKSNNNYLNDKNLNRENNEKKTFISSKSETINQIRNVAQEKKAKPEVKSEAKALDTNKINDFEKLLEICNNKKEMKLKYELEKNVNLVRFEQNRIEISFNDSLDKNFVKDLSLKLYEWTNERWIITLSKVKGDISIKEKQINKHKELINQAKNSNLYKSVLEKFPDANLFDVTTKNDIEDK